MTPFAWKSHHLKPSYCPNAETLLSLCNHVIDDTVAQSPEDKFCAVFNLNASVSVSPLAFCSLAGVSRSVTLVVAYIMTVTRMGWQEALAAVKVVRPCAGPNLGFQHQLQEFEATQANQVSSWDFEATKKGFASCKILLFLL